MSTDTREDLFAVILERSSPRPVAEIGRILATETGIPSADAILRVRYGAGLVAENLSGSVADRIVDALSKISILAVRVQAACWGRRPSGYPVVAFEFPEDAVLARLHNDVELVVARNDVFGLDVYGLEPVDRDVEPQEDAPGRRRGRGDRGRAGRSGPSSQVGALTETLLAGLPGRISDLSPRGKALLEKLSEEGHESVEFRLTLYCADPTGPLHVRKDRFDYSCLGEQKKSHSMDNFLTLIEEITTRLPDLWNREVADAFVQDLDYSRVLRFKREEVQGLHRWMHYWIQEEVKRRGEEGAS